MSPQKYVFDFDEKAAEDPQENKNLLGGKGSNLGAMSKMGFPVPPGFTVTTEACGEYLKNNNNWPEGLEEEVRNHLTRLEEKMGKKLGDNENPLLVSVRSGAKFSMPGMMDTVLNLGLNDTAVQGLAKKTGNERFAYDSYRRFIQMFGNIVSGIKITNFEHVLHAKKEEVGAVNDVELTAEHLKELVVKYKEVYKRESGHDFPTDPFTQLKMAIEAVFGSWNNRRAVDYRKHEGIPHDIYTAVNVQSMVFGNQGPDSGTGVAFTRSPASGDAKPFGEFLYNAQGEDVVAGLRTPLPILKLGEGVEGEGEPMPNVLAELEEIFGKLEEKFKDMQDVEFTIEDRKLYLLQTRNGKRTGIAAFKIAYDMVQEGLIDKETAVRRVTPRDIENCLFPSVTWVNAGKGMYKGEDEQTHTTKIIGEGLPAGPGAATGHIVFDSDLAEEIVKDDKKAPFEITLREKSGKPKLILVKSETSPEDFHGMTASQGILTLHGGMTSHAALVARQIGKRCIVGAASSGLRLTGDQLVGSEGTQLKQGDPITIDVISGERGNVYPEAMPIITPTDLPTEVATILDWADELAKIKVRTNADKKGDTQTAVDFKSTGTGLARTEHQFFDALPIVRAMILAETKEDRKKELDKMLELQKKDFKEVFEVSAGRPVTIRLIDPPLHEFLPNELELREKIWKENLGPDSREQVLLDKVLEYKEANPMLGLRGCRLGLMFPEITEMQARAIIEAAMEVEGSHPEIMVPLVGFRNEFKLQREIIDRVAKQTMEEKGKKVEYLVGTMIEIPRAALTADEIAGGPLGAEFFSFGTNDLHQMTLGFSRDDVAKFLPFYLADADEEGKPKESIIPDDPFVTIDQHGTGQLMDMCVQKGRKAAEEAGRYLKVGICGEQGGEPQSIDFCYRIGLDYVSCSPFRVPVARLAAAHATLNNPEVDPKYGKKVI